MPEILNTEQRFVDAWWSERIARAIGELPHTAANAFPEADTGKDFRAAIDKAIEGAGLKDELEQDSAFNHKTETEVNGAGAVFTSKTSEMIVVVEAYSDVVLARAWGNDLKECTEVCDKIVKQIPRKDKPVQREDLIPVAFWHAGAGGEGSCYIKDVQCPAFPEIKENYGKKVISDIEWVLNLEEPDALGKIILWHGPPGMGKTYAVRALARHWSNELDATVEVVLDPEQMLASAGYMRSILLSEERAGRARKSIKRRKKGKSGEDDRPLRLIVIEDSAELFSEGCRNTAGFSRLLNLTDGIIGQGLRCIFLLTANEELGKIDAAVRRAGRCLQQLEFPKLTKAEGAKWLKGYGVEGAKLNEEVSLADLYAIRYGKREPAETGSGAKFGFGN